MTNRNERGPNRKRALRIERLDDRVVLDGVGLGISDPLPWFDPGALTFSFAPDGTRVADQESRLFAELDQLSDTALWQQEFESAFNEWLQPLGASIREVPDSGGDFGIAGPAQGDTRFGDIRIAAVPLSHGTMATSVPHSVIVQGTWAGDILLNSDATWSNLQEVFSVALHEFGHVLGLGHSADPLSPMFLHGVYNVDAPTANDITDLLDLYSGIRFEQDGEHDANQNPSPVSPPAADSVISLAPSIGSTVRYVSQGSLADSSSSIVFRLEPASGDAQNLENLNVVVQSTDAARMGVDISIVDERGFTAETRILHHNQGSVVAQASGVNSNRTYFVTITPAAGSSRFNPGDFSIVMDYGREVRASERIADLEFDKEHVAFEQSLTVSSSRLVHLRLDSHASLDVDTTIFAVLVDAEDNVLTRIAMHPGISRSAPLTFLPEGDYRLLFSASANDKTLHKSQVEVFLDEVSIDVGPGVVDPTGTPYLACSEPGADPNYCYDYVPIISPPPTVPYPQPSPYYPNYPWWWDYGYSCSDYQGVDLVNVQDYDYYWWEFYLEVCQSTNPIPTPTNPTPTNPTPTNPTPTNPTPTNPTPTNPTPTNPTPTNPGPVVSPWQNPANPLDVSGDSVVSAFDALIVINCLNRYSGNVQLTSAVDGTIGFADVNGDFVVSAVDALEVIGGMNRQSIAEAELLTGLISTSMSTLKLSSSSVAMRDREPIGVSLLF